MNYHHLRQKISKLQKQSEALRKEIARKEETLLETEFGTDDYMNQLNVLSQIRREWMETLAEHHEAFMTLANALCARKAV